MPIITFETGHGERPALTLDLGHAQQEPGGRRRYGEGDLDAYSGNLYVFVDGAAYGSLFFIERDGRLNIELGQYRNGPHQEWEPANPLTDPVHDAGPLYALGVDVAEAAR